MATRAHSMRSTPATRAGLYRYLLRQCREPAAAEELFQDVWMNLIRARAGYTVQAKFTTYLYRLAHNRLIDHYRKHGHAVVTSFDAEEGRTWTIWRTSAGRRRIPLRREAPGG
jgi:RNA polymerase sigma factor (sigma-70 family)